ncbi:MAG: tetratricopeptide repeat protein [Candidatus Omnitrophica bacterium]|nr:tetratricopeptide repeat protein [Candidatus Omnitrophota bacterium]
MKSCKKPLIFLLLCLIFFLIAAMYFRPIEIEDIWYHLKTGELIVTQGFLPFHDVYSYTSNNVEWFATQWLGDVIFYGAYRLFGLLGLQLFRCLFFTLIAVLLFFYLKRRLLLSTAAILTLAVSFALFNRLFCRPFFFSYLFILFYFYILTLHHKNPFGKMILFIPLLQFVWQNIYIGGAYLSLSMQVVFLAGAYLDHAWPGIAIVPPGESHRDARHIVTEQRDLLMLIGACLFCLFLNPYGIKGILYPLRIFFSSRQADMFIGGKFISEWRPSFNTFSGIFSSYRLTYKVMAGITAVSLLVHIKKVCRAQILLFIVFLLFSLLAVRLQDAFSILSACIFAESFFDCRGLPIKVRERWRMNISLRRIAKFSFGLFLLSILAWRCVDLFTAKTIIEGKTWKKYGSGIDLESNPELALKFLDEHNLYGNIYNSDQYGAFIIWKEFPKRKVFIDGRFDLYCSSGVFQKVLLLHRQEYWEKLVRDYDIGIIILTTDFLYGQNINVTRYALDPGKWTCVYFDGRCVVFLRNEKFAKDFLGRYKADLFGKPADTPGILEEYEKSSLKYPNNLLLRKIIGQVNNFPDPLDSVAKGNWLINIGSYDQAVVQYLHALAINPLLEKGDFWLGYCFYKKGSYDNARILAKRALEIEPSDPDILLLAAELEKDRDAGRALYYYKQALRHRPNDPAARGLLADFAFLKGYDKEAIAQYLWLNKVMPERVDYQIKLGVSYGRLGEFNKARQVLEKLLDYDAGNIDAHFNLAVAYRYLGLIDLCKKELKETLALNPEDARARTYLLELERQ